MSEDNLSTTSSGRGYTLSEHALAQRKANGARRKLVNTMKVLHEKLLLKNDDMKLINDIAEQLMKAFTFSDLVNMFAEEYAQHYDADPRTHALHADRQALSAELKGLHDLKSGPSALEFSRLQREYVQLQAAHAQFPERYEELYRKDQRTTQMLSELHDMHERVQYLEQELNPTLSALADLKQRHSRLRKKYKAIAVENSCGVQ